MDDGSSQDAYYLSINGENNEMEVDNEVGSYASFGCASNIEPNVMIDCCVESDGNNSVRQESGGEWDDNGGESSSKDILACVENFRVYRLEAYRNLHL